MKNNYLRILKLTIGNIHRQIPLEMYHIETNLAGFKVTNFQVCMKNFV